MARAKLITFSQALICPPRREGESDVKVMDEHFVTNVQLHVLNYVIKKQSCYLLVSLAECVCWGVVLPLFRARSAS